MLCRPIEDHTLRDHVLSICIFTSVDRGSKYHMPYSEKKTPKNKQNLRKVTNSPNLSKVFGDFAGSPHFFKSSF